MVNKLWLTPDLLVRLDTRRLRTSIGVEAVLMFIVIAISTLLAATSPVEDANTPISQPEPAQISELNDTGDFELQVALSSTPYSETQPHTLTPAERLNALARADSFRPGGAP